MSGAIDNYQCHHCMTGDIDNYQCHHCMSVDIDNYQCSHHRESIKMNRTCQNARFIHKSKLYVIAPVWSAIFKTGIHHWHQGRTGAKKPRWQLVL
jgi:membrane-bound inhibitor of C-type lysozyme